MTWQLIVGTIAVLVTGVLIAVAIILIRRADRHYTRAIEEHERRMTGPDWEDGSP